MEMPSVDSVDDLRRIESAARRITTPCGNGVLVWHAWGPADGPSVLLLHGGSGSWNHWVRNIEALVATGYQVLAPDLPGFGDSDVPPAGFDADTHAPWILHGLERLVGPAPCPVVAFSFGCMVAAFMATEAPSRIAQLVFVGAPALTLARGPGLNLAAWRDHPPGPQRTKAHQHNLGAIMLRWPDRQSSLAAELHGANAERDRIPHRRRFKTDVVAKLLPAIAQPLWAIWGAEDALHRGQLEAYASALALAPNFQSLTILPRGGHWVQFEAATAFNATLKLLLGEPAR